MSKAKSKSNHFSATNLWKSPQLLILFSSTLWVISWSLKKISGTLVLLKQICCLIDGFKRSQIGPKKKQTSASHKNAHLEEKKIHSLKAPENCGLPKRIVVFQPSFFRDSGPGGLGFNLGTPLRIPIIRRCPTIQTTFQHQFSGDHHTQKQIIYLDILDKSIGFFHQLSGPINIVDVWVFFQLFDSKKFWDCLIK